MKARVRYWRFRYTRWSKADYRELPEPLWIPELVCYFVTRVTCKAFRVHGLGCRGRRDHRFLGQR